MTPLGNRVSQEKKKSNLVSQKVCIWRRSLCSRLPSGRLDLASSPDHERLQLALLENDAIGICTWFLAHSLTVLWLFFTEQTTRLSFGVKNNAVRVSKTSRLVWQLTLDSVKTKFSFFAFDSTNA